MEEELGFNGIIWGTVASKMSLKGAAQLGQWLRRRWRSTFKPRDVRGALRVGRGLLAVAKPMGVSSEAGLKASESRLRRLKWKQNGSKSS